MRNKLSLFIFSFLVCSCSSNVLNGDIDSNKINNKEPILNSLSNDAQEYLKNKSEFVPSDSYKSLSTLPDYKKIKDIVWTGREDPFSKPENMFSDLKKDIKLVGLYDFMNKRYALIQFNDKELEIEEGYVGGDNALMLPKGVKLIKVDPKENMIILDYNGQKTLISLFEYI